MIPTTPVIRDRRPIRNTPCVIVSGKESSTLRIWAIKVLAKRLTGPIADH